MKKPTELCWLFLALILLTELVGITSRNAAGFTYGVWLIIMLIFLLTLPKDFNRNTREFCIAFSGMPALRMLYFLAPFNVLPGISGMLFFYGVMLIISLLYIKYLDIDFTEFTSLKIELRDFFTFNGMSHLLALLPIAIGLGLMGANISMQRIPFSAGAAIVVIFSSLVYLIFLLAVLQTTLELVPGFADWRNQAFYLSFLGVAMTITQGNLIPLVFLSTFVIILAFSTTKNLLLAFIMEIIINLFTFVRMH